VSRRLLLVATLGSVALLMPLAAAQADSGLTPSAASVDLGDIPAGAGYWNAPALTFTNNGGDAITVKSVSPTDFTTWTYWGAGGTTCLPNVVLNPGDACNFHPLPTWQSVNGHDPLGQTSTVYTVTTDQGATQVPVTAKWVGVKVHSQPEGGAWEAGAVGNDVRAKTFRVYAVGNTPLNISSVSLDTSPSTHPGAPSFAIVSDGCSGEAVAPGAFCAVTVDFAGPDDAAYLDFASNAYATGDYQWQGGGAFRAALNGTRIAPFHVATHHASTTHFTLGKAGAKPHGVFYQFTSSYTPVNLALQVVNSHGRVVRSWTGNDYFYNHHPLHPSVWWSGRNQHGRFVKPGRYHFRVVLRLWGYKTYGGGEHVTVKRTA
jgi:hypothetical protein